MDQDNQELFNHSLKLLAKSSMIVLAGIIISKIFTYLYRIVIARNFGPEIYGLFSLSIMISGWFIAFFALGLNEGLLRYISIFRGKNEKNKIQYLFKSSFLFLLILGLVGGIILFCFSNLISLSIFNEPDLMIFLKFFSISVPLTILLNTFLPIIRAHEEIKWHTFITRILLSSFKLTFLILFIFLGFKSNAIIYSYLLGIFGTLLTAFFVCRYKFPYIFRKAEKIKKKEKIFRKVFSYSWPLAFYAFIWQIFHWTDTFIIGIFRTVGDVGVYNAVVPTAFFLTIPLSLFLQLFFPLINKEYARGHKEIVKQISQQIGKWVFTAVLPLFILMVIFPGAFINILFGNQYLEGEVALRILSFGVLFFSIFSISHNLLAMSGRSKLILFDIIFITAFNIILNILLIPKYGIAGAAFASSASLVLLSIIFMFQCNYYLSILPIRRKMISVLTAGFLSAAILLYLKKFVTISIINLSILLIFFLLSYIIIILLIRGLDKNDIMIIKSFFNKFKEKFKS